MTDEAMPPVKRFKPGDQIHVSTQQVWLILVAHVEAAKRTPGAPLTAHYGGDGSVTHLMGCVSACKTDPLIGVIGVQN